MFYRKNGVVYYWKVAWLWCRPFGCKGNTHTPREDTESLYSPVRVLVLVSWWSKGCGLDSQNCLDTGRTCVVLLYSAATDIMNDPHQVLFQTCCYGNGACVCPVPKVSNDPRCMLHVTVANLEYHLPLKREPLEIQVRVMWSVWQADIWYFS